MKKRTFLLVGVLCSIGYYSCQKNIDANAGIANDGSVNEAKQNFGSGIFDPTFLVSIKHRQLDTIQTGFSFTEGPAVDKQGNVFFTDQPNNKIWKYDTEGKLSVFLDSAGRSNGMYFD